MYTATITSASIKLRESRIIAGLLLDSVDEDEWRDAIINKNVLQMRSVNSIKRISRILRARLEPMGHGLWDMVHRGERDQATQAAFAAAVKHSRLLGDFLDITIREQRMLFAKKIEHPMWTNYIQDCMSRHPEMPHWSEKTVARLRSSVFSMLADVGCLNNTRELMLQNVFVDAQLSEYLENRGETYVLRCLEVME